MNRENLGKGVRAFLRNGGVRITGIVTVRVLAGKRVIGILAGDCFYQKRDVNSNVELLPQN